MAFKKGIKNIEEAQKSTSRVGYLTIKANESAYLRFYSGPDEWIQVAQHGGVKTKPAPDGAKNWPKNMGAVCRLDTQIREILGVKDCYVCDNKLTGFGGNFAKPTNRIWALAIERETVMDANTGRIAGMQDVLEDVEVLNEDGTGSGEHLKLPKLVIVNMAWGNFFQPIAAVEKTLGDVRMIDFRIMRTGDGTDTAYQSVQMQIPGVPSFGPGFPEWEAYNRVVRARQIDLEKLVTDQASDLHFARWFDPTKSVTEKGEITAAPTPAKAPAAGGGMDQFSAVSDRDTQAELARLREQLRSS